MPCDECKKAINPDVDMAWALKQFERYLAEHHNAAENIMNLITNVRSNYDAWACPHQVKK